VACSQKRQGVESDSWNVFLKMWPVSCASLLTSVTLSGWKSARESKMEQSCLNLPQVVYSFSRKRHAVESDLWKCFCGDVECIVCKFATSPSKRPFLKYTIWDSGVYAQWLATTKQTPLWRFLKHWTRFGSLNNIRIDHACWLLWNVSVWRFEIFHVLPSTFSYVVA
jgi:hypothetical protein